MAFYKETDFGLWLNVYYPSSISSYKSGMGSLIVWLDSNKGLWKTTGGTRVRDFEDYLKDINTDTDRSTLFSAALNIIQKAIDNGMGNKPVLQNFKSYLNAYEEFFCGLVPINPSAKGIRSNQRAVLRSNSSDATYTQIELISEFKGRILTQDRISMVKDILFPIRLMNRLWPIDTDAWADAVCSNIRLIVKDNKTGTIKELKGNQLNTLRIRRNGSVIITDKKSVEYTLCTSYSDPHEYLKVNGSILEYFRKRKPVTDLSCRIPKGGYTIDKNQNIIDSATKRIVLWHVKPVKARAIGDITIDHDIPISQVLIDNKSRFKQLKGISNLYRNISGINGLNVSAKLANEFCSRLTPAQITLFNSIGFPTTDMKIIGNYKLVLMGRNENILKSNN